MDSLSGLHCMVESATRCHMNKVIEKIEKTTNYCVSCGIARVVMMQTCTGQS